MRRKIVHLCDPPSPHLKVCESFLSILTFLRWKKVFSKVAQNDVRSLERICYTFLDGGGGVGQKV